MPLASGYTSDSIGVTLGWPLSPLPKVNEPSGVGLVVVVKLSACTNGKRNKMERTWRRDCR
jgi:hypothetical protein